MICISWGLPSSKRQADSLGKLSPGDFNVDENYLGLTQNQPFTADLKEELQKKGFFINNTRIQLGAGEATYLRAKSSLGTWRNFQLGWATVDPSTPVKPKQQFLVRVNEMLLVWLLQPLEIKYVQDSNMPPGQAQQGPSSTDKKGLFAFGSSTLKGHLLAGEERFSVEWGEDDSVWYEVLSFSKPAAILSRATYPYIQWRQRLFAKHSGSAMLKAVTESSS